MADIPSSNTDFDFEGFDLLFGEMEQDLKAKASGEGQVSLCQFFKRKIGLSKKDLPPSAVNIFNRRLFLCQVLVRLKIF